MQTTKINKLATVFLLLLITFVSCDAKRVFDQYQTISNGSWKKKSKINFNFNVNDTISKRNLYFNLRNNNNYPFSNLFLIANIKFPDGTQITDTLEYDMTDKTGKFLGRGFTEIKENKLFYKENISFPIKGNYIVSVYQAMRKNGEIEGVKSLEGITEVGFRIEKTE